MHAAKQGVTLFAATLIVGVVIGLGTAAAAESALGDMKVEEVVNSYPLKTCIVSGEALGTMGEPHKLIFKQEIKFCCKGCVKDFKKDPLKYMAKLAAAAEKEDEQAGPAATHGNRSGHENSGDKKEQDHSGH